MILFLRMSGGDCRFIQRVQILFTFPRCFIAGQFSSVRSYLHAYVGCLLHWTRMLRYVPPDSEGLFKNRRNLGRKYNGNMRGRREGGVGVACKIV